MRRLRSRDAPGVKLEHKPKLEGSVKRQRSIDLTQDDDDGDVTIASINPVTRGKRMRVGPSPDVEILDLTED